MRGRRILLVALAAVLLLALPLAAAAAPPSKPLLGTWWSIDVDGSFQKLTLAGGKGGVYKLQYRDNAASVCDDVPDVILYAAAGKGEGQVFATEDGQVLVTEMDIWCMAKPPIFYGAGGDKLLYDPSADTLTSAYGPVWKRMSAK